MNRTKTYFGFMILFFTFLIILASVFYSQLISFQSKLVNPITGSAVYEAINDDLVFWKNNEVTTYVVEENSTSECVFIPPTRPTVVLRIDDLGAWHYYDTILSMTSGILSRNMAVSFGIIPHELEKDQDFINWILSIKDFPNVEIAQHGFMHEPSEFKELNAVESYNRVQEGKNSIVENLRVEPITFIPPSNDYTENTVLALQESGFRIISARNSEYKTDGSMIYLGSDAQTANYYEGRFIPVEEVLENCRKSLNEKNLCVIVLHPQDYVLDYSPTEIDLTKYAEYERLLNELDALDVDFRTFKDFVKCSNTTPT